MARRRGARSARVTREALAGRRWTLALLAAPPGAAVPAPPAIGEPAWRLLLDVESCGLPLARALRAVPEAARLPAAVLALVREAEQRELQRVLMARAQLRALDALARAHAVAPVVLKGGAVVLHDEPLDLGDLDLLMASEAEARRFAAVLEGCGYAAAQPDAPVVLRNHLSARYLPGGLPVELHVRTAYGDGEAVEAPSVPLADCRALRGTEAAGEIARVLRHTVRHHYFRRGHLRDVVLLAWHVRRCEGAGLEALRGRLSGEVDGAAQLRLLEMAESVAWRRGMAGAGPDPFAGVSAMRYEARQATGLALERRVFRSRLDESVQRWLGDRRDWRRWLARSVTEPVRPGTSWDLARLRRRAPLVAEVAGRAGRLPHLLGAVAYGAVVAALGRRRAERAVADSAALF